ncbi:tereporin-Ca1-like [Paramisgurnus dabryanus]|uniref:tereporin-Ca1-like n=1 Tax=Paramisgurnus dabryanus TaxID=90735 RepID=UPI0031F37043
METAESVSANINTYRNCTIEINNMSNVYNLINPHFYTYSGYCCHPPQPTISSKKTGVCAFSKTPHTACGSVGVMTYNLFHMEKQVCTERIAILFSVPYNYNHFVNVFGVGVFDITCECNHGLYNYMYYGKDSRQFTSVTADVSGITFNAQTVELRATMSNVGKAIIKLEIVDIPDISPVVEIKQRGECCSKFCPFWCYRYCCTCNCLDK